MRQRLMPDFALLQKYAWNSSAHSGGYMTPGLGFALFAMICFGVSDLIYKRGSTAGIEAGEFVMLQSWVFCPAVTVYAWLSGTLHLSSPALWGSLAGVFLFVALFNFAASLRGGAVSTNAPIFRLNFTLTAALAILLLGEVLTLVKAAVEVRYGSKANIALGPRHAALPRKRTSLRPPAQARRDGLRSLARSIRVLFLAHRVCAGGRP
jgi:uncharacterized membrane protein